MARRGACPVPYSASEPGWSHKLPELGQVLPFTASAFTLPFGLVTQQIFDLLPHVLRDSHFMTEPLHCRWSVPSLIADLRTCFAHLTYFAWL